MDVKLSSAVRKAIHVLITANLNMYTKRKNYERYLSSLNDHHLGERVDFNKNADITSEDHLVLMGIPAKFTTPVEP